MNGVFITLTKIWMMYQLLNIPIYLFSQQPLLIIFIFVIYLNIVIQLKCKSVEAFIMH